MTSQDQNDSQAAAETATAEQNQQAAASSDPMAPAPTVPIEESELHKLIAAGLEDIEKVEEFTEEEIRALAKYLHGKLFGAPAGQ